MLLSRTSNRFTHSVRGTLGVALLGVSGCAGVLKSTSEQSAVPKPLSPEQVESPISTEPLANPAEMGFAIELETARLAEKRGMDQEAIVSYRRVRELDPKHPGVSHSLAVLYDRSGQTDAAEREYAAALAEAPRNASVHCDYGYFLYATGRLNEAEAELRRAIELQPSHQQAMTNLALVVGHQRRYEESLALFEKSIGPAAALYNVGMLKLRHGDLVESQRMIAEASRRDPSINQGNAILERLANHPSDASKSGVLAAGYSEGTR